MHESGTHRTRSPSPKSTNLCHLLDTPSTSSELAAESGTRRTRSPSLKSINLFQLLDAPSSSSSASAHESGTHRTRSPSQGSIDLYHLLDSPSPSSDSSHESDVRRTHSPSPVPSRNNDFGVPEPISSEPQEDIGTQAPPSSELQIVGSSSDASEPSREFQITSSSARPTLVLTGWIWGEPAPPPVKGKQNDKSGSIEEVERAGNSVRHNVHVLKPLLRDTDCRMIPIIMG